jgi:adenine-specific DNA methylase
MIERWFPSQEVSENSTSGWGSGNTERNLFTWFAARPTAQAKAAVITSLLPWPDDECEQVRLQTLVRESMQGRYSASKELQEELEKANPEGARVLDPFSGRGIIPLEAARLGLPADALDYSPVAVIASKLLTDYPFRNWSSEPTLPFAEDAGGLPLDANRLVRDVSAVLNEIGRRHVATMSAFYPAIDGQMPWGYLWAVTLPCQECGNRFPLVASYELRRPSTKPSNKLRKEMIDKGKKIKGKAAVCPFCDHVHSLALHQRLAGEGLGEDALLVVADVHPIFGKVFRIPTSDEILAARSATTTLAEELPFGLDLPAIPNERIPENNGATIRPQLYGATTYGDLMCDRQTLGFIRLARIVSDLGIEMEALGVSREYVRALTGYAAANIVRKLKYATRGSPLQIMPGGGNKVVVCLHNEGALAFSYDFFEAGIGTGPGTWNSLIDSYMSTLQGLMSHEHGEKPVHVDRGSAVTLPFRNGSMAAVVTDPPYDAMVYYSDSSDLFYVWLKRALRSAWPELLFTSDPRGIQEKAEEIIVKEHGVSPGEPRTREHYDRMIARAFGEARRVVREDGVVTIVFGHGEPEVWHRLLKAITDAGLVVLG